MLCNVLVIRNYSMTLLDFVPLLFGISSAIVSGAYLRYLLFEDKDEDNYEQTTFEANSVEIKVPKSCFSLGSNESEKVLQEIQQKTNTKVILEHTNESYVCKIEGSFQNREHAKSIIYALISNHFAGLLEEIECSKKRNELPVRNEEKDECEAKDALCIDDGSIVTLPAFKLIQVFVSAVVDPNRFWVQLIDSKATELEELEKEMNAFYTVAENRKLYALEDVSVDDLVAAPFNNEDSLYRARVVEVVNRDGNVELELFYVDYGDDERIAIERAFSLKPEFLKLKMQAVQCSLANIEPRGGQWSDEAVEFLCEITEVAKWKVMEAEVVAVGKKGEPMLKLFEVKDGRHFDIADELVRHDYASYCHKQGFATPRRMAHVVPGGEEDDYSSDDELDIV